GGCGRRPGRPPSAERGPEPRPGRGRDRGPARSGSRSRAAHRCDEPGTRRREAHDRPRSRSRAERERCDTRWTSLLLLRFNRWLPLHRRPTTLPANRAKGPALVARSTERRAAARRRAPGPRPRLCLGLAGSGWGDDGDGAGGVVGDLVAHRAEEEADEAASAA